MGIIELFLLAVGLSMDAFAVSVCKGLAMQKITVKKAAVVGLWFGGFQALMPLLGYFLGKNFKKYIENVDHWVAFALLALIGANMIKEALSKNEEKTDDSLAFKTMFLLAVATSIDAVSYTHLDVYKRQAICCALSFANALSLASFDGLYVTAYRRFPALSQLFPIVL